MEKTPDAGTSEAFRKTQSGTDVTYHKQPNLQVALDLAGAGFTVFPCRPAQEGDDGPKSPYTSHGFKDASKDPEQIRAWWRKWPRAIVGLPTGSGNGLAVLDLDRKDGLDGVADLESLGFDPDSLSPLTVETASNGLHLYFSWPEGLKCSKGKIAPGIDVRAEGGYVIAPGAVGDLGAYVARGGATLGQSLPEWPAALLQTRAVARPVDVSDDDDDMPTDAELRAMRVPDWAEIVPALNSIDASDRDTWFNIGCALHHESGGSDSGFKVWAEWSQSCPEKYDARDQKRTWKSIKGSDDPITIATLFDLAAKSGWVRRVDLPDLSDLFGVTSRLTFLTPADCDAAPSRGYLIKGLLAPRDVGCIFGAPGAGKSLLAPFLGYALARGAEAFGMRTKAGPVFYVAAEDSHGMRGRVKALRQKYGDAPDFTLVDGVSDLLRVESPDLAALVDAVKARKPALIFLDTLAMAFPGLEENSAEAMGRVVAVARRLTEWGAAVVLIHHDTKAEGSTPRGHSLLNGALDMALHVKRNESGSIGGTLTKNRNGTCARDLTFTIGTEDGGQDEDGDLITLPLCEPSVDLFDDALSYKERAALEPLIARQKAETAFSDESEEMACGQSSIPVDEWRDLCKGDKRICDSDKSNSQNAAFRRVKDGLISKGIVRLVLDDTAVELCNTKGLASWS